jgi:hypothetical protein
VRRSAWTALSFAIAWLAVAGATATREQQPVPFAGVLDEHPAIQYAQRPTRERVGALARAMADGQTRLTYREGSGYLQSVLDALRIAADSQLLVFSKTGVQRASTSPHNPRALYFDDSVVVGFIPGAPLLEIAAHDPEQGVVFYTVDQTDAATAALTRRTSCLTCHVSASTLEVPGLINRNVSTRADGSTLPQLGSNDVDHRTPLLQRWGGMYVTGKYFATPYTGRKEHAGNVTMTGDPPDPARTSNEGLIRWIDSSPTARGYPSADSDIASMMVFDHQAHGINLLTRLNWESRADGAWRGIAAELVDYFLFVGEAAPPARLVPRAAFAAQFAAAARQDRQGRSLRDLDLDTRLLRYPCSYMIYSSAFEHLPPRAKQAVYSGMWDVLSGRGRKPKYSHLSAADRRAIIEILRDTKNDLPEVFRESTR